MINLTKSILMNEAGDGTGGGGGASGGIPDDFKALMVSMAETNKALAERLASLEAKVTAPAPAPKEPASDPKPATQQDLNSLVLQELAALRSERAGERIQAKKTQLAERVLAGIPAQNKGLVEAVLRGHPVYNSVNETADIDKLGVELSTTLKVQYPTLFTQPGSNRPITQISANGVVDWKTAQDWNDVPPELLNTAPLEAIERFIRKPNGIGDNSSIPQSTYRRKN